MSKRKIISSPSGEIAAVDSEETESTSPNREQNEESTVKSGKNKRTKRENAIQWDDYFMAVSFLSAMRSKDPSTQVGACIVNADKKIVGIGYNGFPRGCSDDLLPWGREGDNELDTKYPVHLIFCFVRNSCSLQLLLYSLL